LDGTVDCGKAVGQLLELDIEGSTIELEPGDYARPSVQMSDGDDEVAEAAATAALSGETFAQNTGATPLNSSASPPPPARCHPTLMPIDLPEPLGPKLFILGEPVLKKYYTTYDWHNKRIGFGLATHKREDDQDEPEDVYGEPLLL
jgi:hypothetical protein